MKINYSPLFRLFFILVFYSSLISCSRIFRDRTMSAGLDKITPQLLKQYIDYLAADTLKGRNSPSPGLDTAAAYLVRNLSAMGIQPVNGSYYQYFNLCTTDLGTDNYLKISASGNTTAFTIKKDFIPFEITGNRSCEGKLVFAGYGITATGYNYDDYEKIDAKGKIVLIFRHLPRERDPNSLFNSGAMQGYSSLSTKMRNAIMHGATGMLVVTEPFNYASLRPRGFPWPSLSKTLPRDALNISICSGDDDRIPVVHIGEDVINAFFGSIDSLKNLQRRIDSLMKPASFDLPLIAIALKTSLAHNEMKVQNVIGLLRGSDPVLSEEYVVAGGHYDHVGYKKQHKPGEDYIFNGADDNASGTSGVLAIARAFTSMPVKPERSLIFLFFAAEEKGLFGSEYYTSHPLFPLEKTVAMINLDMIGRNSVDSLMVIGNKQSPDINSILQKQNKRTGFILDYSMGGLMSGSDHFNFYKNNVPFIFLFSGFHKDYHTVGDNPDKIDGIKAAKVAKLAFRTAWYLANDRRHYRLIRSKNDDLFH